LPAKSLTHKHAFVEDIALDAFLANRFGFIYAAGPSKPRQISGGIAPRTGEKH